MPSGVYQRPKLPERFWPKVSAGEPDECWMWVGAKSLKSGYGQIALNGHRVGAHRVSFEINVRPLLAGEVVDHLCRNPSCVNPRHLEAVTMAENTRRGILFDVIRAKAQRKVVCKRGHVFSPENTTVDSRGDRCCRTCQRTKANEWRARNRARVNYLQSIRRQTAKQNVQLKEAA